MSEAIPAGKLDLLGVPLSSSHLIEASAGTGKTFAIATIALRALLESQVEISELLIVTYTRAATAELRERIAKRIHDCLQLLEAHPDDSSIVAPDPILASLAAKRFALGQVASDCLRLRLALRSMDQASIVTIHGFCQRALRDRAFESGSPFENEFERDGVAFIRNLAADLWSQTTHSIDPYFYRFLLSQGFSLQQVEELCRAALRDPTLPLIPSTPTKTSDDPQAQWQRAFETARLRWMDERDEIVDLLINSATLYKNSYSDTTVSQKILPETDALFASQVPQYLDKESFAQRFTLGYIRSHTRKGKAWPKHTFFEEMDQLFALSAALKETWLSQLVSLKVDIVARARVLAHKRKFETRSIGFDDLLLQLREALRHKTNGQALANALGQQFPFALIDEFQDTDPAQYEIFQRIFLRSPHAQSPQGPVLFLIGDPKQAIYRFRGADLRSYLRARDEVQGGVHTLDTNFRSSPNLLEATASLYRSHKRPFLHKELKFSAVQAAPGAKNSLADTETQSAALEILFAGRVDDYGRDLSRTSSKGKSQALNKSSSMAMCVRRTAGEISRILSGGNSLGGREIAASDIAVLVRTNRQAQEMQRALTRQGVPAVMETDFSVFSSEESADMVRLLRALSVPGDAHAVKAALGSVFFGYSGSELSEIEEQEELWTQWLERFGNWRALWQNKGFLSAFSTILRDQNVREELLSQYGGRRKLVNLLQLAELVQTRSEEQSGGIQTLADWLTALRQDRRLAMKVGESALLRLETDRPAVNVVTIHKSKGLEYQLVYCPFAWNAPLAPKRPPPLVHFYNEDGRTGIDLGSDSMQDHRDQEAREALAEDLRLLYVALTRAKARTTLVWGPMKGFEKSALSYLLLAGDTPDTKHDAFGEFCQLGKELSIESDDALSSRLLEAKREGQWELAIRGLESYQGSRFQEPNASSSETLQPKTWDRSLDRSWRLASFSSLTSNRDSARDHDAFTGPSETSWPSEDAKSAACLLVEFPRGAQAGLALHSILEHSTFGATEDELHQGLESRLGLFGLQKDINYDALVSDLHSILNRPLSPATFSLSDIALDKRIDEMEFVFPLRNTHSALRARDLAKTLAARANAPWSDDYPESVARLDFFPLKGMMRGFIDLCFEHEGRWYIADYKSNFLGATLGDYNQHNTAEAMAHHHYYLQYHIYTLALHRHLASRVPNYQYESHFGGVFYLFLRAMSGDAPAGQGIVFDRMELPDLEALETLFGGSQ